MHHYRPLTFLALLLLLPSWGWAATYYVATNGGGSTCSQNAPCSSINTGIDRLASGDTLFLRGGTYRETINRPAGSIPQGGGSWESATVIAGYPGESVTMLRSGTNVIDLGQDGQFAWLIFRNLTLDAEVTGDGPLSNPLNLGARNHHIRFEQVHFTRGYVNVSGGGDYTEFLNCKSSRAAWYGWYYSGNHTIIDNCEIFDNDGYGIHFFSAGDPSPRYVSDNIIRNNYLHNNGNGPRGNGGTGLTHGYNNVAYNNIIIGDFQGIQIDYECNNCQVYNNTIIGCPFEGIIVGSRAEVAIVRNNILYNNGNDFSNIWRSDTQYSNNLIGTNPQFASTGSAPQTRFALTEGSPARNAGMTLAAVTHDFVGTPRPQEDKYDIGALEYVGPGGPTQPPQPEPPAPRAAVTNLRLRTTP